MTNTPLNPDALAAAINAAHEAVDWQLVESDRADTEEPLEVSVMAAVSAYLAAATAESQKLTDAEWQAFQAIPDQGYSHRAWVDARIAERVAAAQPVVNSVEELHKLPVGARVVISDYYLAHATEIVDDGQWIDLGNGCYLDDEDLQRLLDIEPALVTLRRRYQVREDRAADELADGCTCGMCDPSCKHAKFRPCCGACMAVPSA